MNSLQRLLLTGLLVPCFVYCTFSCLKNLPAATTEHDGFPHSAPNTSAAVRCTVAQRYSNKLDLSFTKLLSGCTTMVYIFCTCFPFSLCPPLNETLPLGQKGFSQSKNVEQFKKHSWIFLSLIPVVITWCFSTLLVVCISSLTDYYHLLTSLCYPKMILNSTCQKTFHLMYHNALVWKLLIEQRFIPAAPVDKPYTSILL